MALSSELRWTNAVDKLGSKTEWITPSSLTTFDRRQLRQICHGYPGLFVAVQLKQRECVFIPGDITGTRSDPWRSLLYTLDRAKVAIREQYTKQLNCGFEKFSTASIHQPVWQQIYIRIYEPSVTTHYGERRRKRRAETQKENDTRALKKRAQLRRRYTVYQNTWSQRVQTCSRSTHINIGACQLEYRSSRS